MQVSQLKVARAKARELYRKYKTHQHYSDPMDREIQRAYQLIAQGRMVIRALESIRLAGVDTQGLPKLAICRADAELCYFTRSQRGSCRFSMKNGWGTAHHTRSHITMPEGSLPPGKERGNYDAAKARVPLVPIHLRPRRALQSYHILWEAEWTPIPPVDPYLLRRIGGDMWLVVAVWDLTEVERAAMATRILG